MRFRLYMCDIFNFPNVMSVKNNIPIHVMPTIKYGHSSTLIYFQLIQIYNINLTF